MAINIDKFATRKPKQVCIFARAEPALRKALHKIADKKKISYNELILRALRSVVSSNV